MTEVKTTRRKFLEDAVKVTVGAAAGVVVDRMRKGENKSFNEGSTEVRHLETELKIANEKLAATGFVLDKMYDQLVYNEHLLKRQYRDLRSDVFLVWSEDKYPKEVLVEKVVGDLVFGNYVVDSIDLVTGANIDGEIYEGDRSAMRVVLKVKDEREGDNYLPIELLVGKGESVSMLPRGDRLKDFALPAYQTWADDGKGGYRNIEETGIGEEEVFWWSTGHVRFIV